MIDRRGERGVEVDLPTISPANHAARPKGARRRHDPTARKEEEWCPGPSQISHLPLEAGDRRGSRRVADRAAPTLGSSRKRRRLPSRVEGDGRKLRQQRGDPKVATPPRPRVDPRSKDDLDAARRAARDAKATRGDTVGGKARGGGRGRGGEGGRGKGTAGGGLASGSSSNEPSTLESSPSKGPRSTSPPDPSAAASASSAAALRRQLDQERAERFRAEELAEQMRAQVQVSLF